MLTLRLLAAAVLLASHGGGGWRSGGGHSYGGSHYGRYSSGGSHYRSHSTGTRSSGTSHATHSKRGSSHAKRDPAERRAFQRTHPCPSTGRTSGACPGYVVDHVQALKRGGADAPSNMQWQTVEDAKAKDRVE
ncbi:MAG TPA: HNH endonuclease signature motif containing protein [Anaeromyxobacteraceae bacterium]|nr:HNH endonuclease signature motif containing protein [Anaeromyxobacteraceae bacterium]